MTLALPQTETDTRLKELPDVDRYVHRLETLDSEIGDRYWIIGDTAVEAHKEGIKQTDLLRAGLRMSSSTLSNCKCNSEFYPVEKRKDLTDTHALTWSILSDIRTYITGDYNQRYKQTFEGAMDFLDHCMNEGRVSADQVKLTIAESKGGENTNPKPLKAVITKKNVTITEVYPDTCELHMVLGEHCEIEPGAYVLTLHKVSEATS